MVVKRLSASDSWKWIHNAVKYTWLCAYNRDKRIYEVRTENVIILSNCQNPFRTRSSKSHRFVYFAALLSDLHDSSYWILTTKDFDRVPSASVPSLSSDVEKLPVQLLFLFLFGERCWWAMLNKQKFCFFLFGWNVFFFCHLDTLKMCFLFVLATQKILSSHDRNAEIWNVVGAGPFCSRISTPNWFMLHLFVLCNASQRAELNKKDQNLLFVYLKSASTICPKRFFSTLDSTQSELLRRDS